MPEPDSTIVLGNLKISRAPPAQLLDHGAKACRLLVIEPGLLLIIGKNALKVLLHGKFHVLGNGHRMPPLRLQQGQVKAKPRTGNNGG